MKSRRVRWGRLAEIGPNETLNKAPPRDCKADNGKGPLNIGARADSIPKAGTPMMAVKRAPLGAVFSQRVKPSNWSESHEWGRTFRPICL